MAPHSHWFLLESVLTGEFSDFSLTCKDHEFKLHHLVVCPQSPVIRAAFLGGFEETASKLVTVNEFDVMTVRSMVMFLYTGDYDPRTDKLDLPLQADGTRSTEEAEINDSDEDRMSEESETSEAVRDRATDNILSHLRVNAIADYYGIKGLVKLSTDKLGTIFRNEQDFRIFPKVIQEMSVSNRDTGLQAIIASAAAHYIEDLTASQILRNLDIESNLAIEIIEACGKRIQKLETELSGVHELKNSYQSAKEREQRAHKAIHAQVRNLITELRESIGCMSCGTQFKCYIDEPAQTETNAYAIRCKSCGRHQP
ncbi:uncharacterized protein FPRN_05197 [Fusarium proliferatum]|nr:uncharacterized protein FPRN_05197 [Fusarium proliferatum]